MIGSFTLRLCYFLFHKCRWSKKLREGTLAEMNLDDVTQDEADEEDGEDEEASDYTECLQVVAEAVVHSLEIDQWVAVFYNEEWYPGFVQQVLYIGLLLVYPLPVGFLFNRKTYRALRKLKP